MKRIVCFIIIFIGWVSLQAQSTDSIPQQRNDSIERTLDEVVVTQKLVEDNGMTKSYLITNDMRKRAQNTAQLIGNLPGMDVDRLSNAIKYLGRDRIKILVDSIEKDEEHIKKLSPKRFSNVEVTVMPSGRYQGYDVLINLKMKPDFTGIEGNLSTYNHINPNYISKDKLGGSSFSGLFDYMNGKWNFYVDDYLSWYHDEKDESYDNLYPFLSLREKTLANPKGMPTAHSYNRGNRLSLNADYKINHKHIIGMVYGLNLKNYDFKSYQVISTENLASGESDEFTSTEDNSNDETSHYVGIFYEGRDIKGWYVGSRINYGISLFNNRNLYERTNGYESLYKTKPDMNYTFFSLYLNRRLFNKISLSIDYNYTNRNRKTRNIIDDEIVSRMRENRHYAGIGIDYQLGMKTYLSGGVWYLNNSINSSGVSTHNSILGFRGMVRHTFNDKLGLLISYVTTTYPPSSSQLSDYGEFTSPYEYSSGNPDLKITKSNSLNCDLNFLNMFTLTGAWYYFHNNVGNIQTEKEGMKPDGTFGSYVYNSPCNYDMHSFNIKLSFYKQIKGFNINSSITYNHDRTKYDIYRIRKNGFDWETKVSYYFDRYSFYTHLYYLSLPRYVINSPQSFAKRHQDILNFMISKDFFNMKLSVSAIYSLPLHLLSNRYYSYRDSPALVSTIISNFPALLDNMLSLSVVYRFSSGLRINRFRKDLHKEL